MPGRVTGLRRYPVKSCRGEDLAAVTVEPWGLAGDRRWMVVDSDGSVVTGRTHPQLVLVTPLPEQDGLRLSRPGADDLVVTEPDGSELRPVAVFADRLHAAPAGPQADAWFSAALGAQVSLVYLDDPRRRPTSPAFSRPADRVSLADAYPLLAVTEESLAAVNGLIAAGPRAAEGPMPVTRFRPNIVTAGESAWQEDGWRRVRIGAVTFRVVKGCDRCVFTTVDPGTAQMGREPLRTLARYRRWDGKSWFGVNLIPDLTPSGHRPTIRVDDEVVVLERGDAADGPLRASA